MKVLFTTDNFLYTAVIGCFGLSIFFLVCCKHEIPGELSEPDVVKIDSALNRYRQAWLTNDTAQVLEALSKDIILFIPGANAKNVEGKSAVRNFWFPPSDIHYPIRKYEISDQRLFGSGIYATAQGRSLLIWDTMKADSLISTDTA